MDQSSVHAWGPDRRPYLFPMKAKPMQFALQTRKSKTNSFQREKRRKKNTQRRSIPTLQLAVQSNPRDRDRAPTCAHLDPNPAINFTPPGLKFSATGDRDGVFRVRDEGEEEKVRSEEGRGAVGGKHEPLQVHGVRVAAKGHPRPVPGEGPQPAGLRARGAKDRHE